MNFTLVRDNGVQSYSQVIVNLGMLQLLYSYATHMLQLSYSQVTFMLQLSYNKVTYSYSYISQTLITDTCVGS